MLFGVVLAFVLCRFCCVCVFLLFCLFVFPQRTKAKAGTLKFQQLSSGGIPRLLFRTPSLWFLICKATTISQIFFPGDNVEFS